MMDSTVWKLFLSHHHHTIRNQLELQNLGDWFLQAVLDCESEDQARLSCVCFSTQRSPRWNRLLHQHERTSGLCALKDAQGGSRGGLREGCVICFRLHMKDGRLTLMEIWCNMMKCFFSFRFCFLHCGTCDPSITHSTGVLLGLLKGCALRGGLGTAERPSRGAMDGMAIFREPSWKVRCKPGGCRGKKGTNRIGGALRGSSTKDAKVVS